jgi:FkbM family methyltransferase
MDGLTYFIEHVDEFFEEKGHDELLRRLKVVIQDVVEPVLCLDVGSNVGEYLSHLVDLAPEKNRLIMAFEPNPVNLEALRNAVRATGATVRIMPNAVSDIAEGIVPFYNYSGFNANRPGNTLGGLRGGGEHICDVEITSLDKCLEDYPLHVIKILKIDTEGNDTNVLRGIEKNIDRVRYIMFECSNCFDDHRGPGEEFPMRGIVEFLSNHGFHTYYMGTRGLLRVDGEYWDDGYESRKMHANCFSLKSTDLVIGNLISGDGYYV